MSSTHSHPRREVRRDSQSLFRLRAEAYSSLHRNELLDLLRHSCLLALSSTRPPLRPLPTGGDPTSRQQNCEAILNQIEMIMYSSPSITRTSNQFKVFAWLWNNVLLSFTAFPTPFILLFENMFHERFQGQNSRYSIRSTIYSGSMSLNLLRTRSTAHSPKERSRIPFIMFRVSDPTPLVEAICGSCVAEGGNLWHMVAHSLVAVNQTTGKGTPLSNKVHSKSRHTRMPVRGTVM